MLTLFDKQSLPLKCSKTSKMQSIFKCPLHLETSVLIDLQCARPAWLFYYVTCYGRNYSLSFTSKLRTHGADILIKNPKPKKDKYLANLKADLTPQPPSFFIYLSQTFITRNYRYILRGMSFVSSREQREFPAKWCWNTIADVYYLASTLPIEYRPCLLLGYCFSAWIRQRWEIHLSALTVPSAGWVRAEEVTCNKA